MLLFDALRLRAAVFRAIDRETTVSQHSNIAGPHRVVQYKMILKGGSVSNTR